METAQNRKTTSAVPIAKGGWLRTEMPNAAALIDDLREQLGPELVQGMLDNLKHGRGYVLDETTGLALGSVPDTHQVLGRDARGVSRVRARD